MNIVEFALKLRDMASTPLRQFGTAASQTFTRANQMAGNLSTHNRVLGQSYNELQARIRQVENTIRTSTIPTQIRAARRELEALQRQSNNHVGRIGGGASAPTGGGSGGGLMGMLGGVGGMMKGAAIGLGITALTAFGSGISDSISKSLERQQIQTSFNVLAGNEEKGGALTNQLVGLQKDTILGSEVFQNAQTMMGFGFKSEEVYDNLKMLGDVSMGDAQKLGSLTLAFSQIRAGGKLTGQDLLQLINAGFNPLESMAQKTGKSVALLKDEMSKGLISFEMVQQAFKDATSEGGRFENMLGKIAETPAGKVQQLAGEWDEFKVSAGAAFMPLVSMALDLAQAAMPIIEGLIAPLATGVQTVVDWIKQAANSTGGWMDYVETIKNLFMNSVVPLIQKLWGLIMNIVTKLFDFISKSQLLKDIFEAIYTVFGVVYEIVGYVVDALSWIFDSIIMPLLNGIEKAYRFAKELLGGKDEVTIKQQAVITTAPSPLEKKDQQTTQQLLTSIATNTASNNASAKGSESAISGGGQKIINIQMPKFLDNINIYPASVTEGVNEMERMMREMFARILLEGGR